MAEEGGEAAEGGGENKQELQELEAEGMINLFIYNYGFKHGHC